MSLEEALPHIEATLGAGAAFRFFQRGTSMLPMLKEGRDSVSIVSPCVRAPKVGEVILYRRKNGAFVLHRAVRMARDGSFVCCGDNQTILERGVLRESIIGVLDGYYKDGRWISADDAEYKKYVRKRMRTAWLRYLKGAVKKIIG